MDDSVKKRTPWYIEIINEKRRLSNWTIEQMARMCGISPTLMGFILSGERKPSLDTLFKLSEGLGIPFEDFAFSFVFIDAYDEDQKPRKVGFLKLNNQRRPKDGNVSGLLTGVSEVELEDFYNKDVSGDFLGFVKRYLVDKVYRMEYQEFKKQKFIDNKLTPIKKQLASTRILLLEDIISALYDMDENGIKFIREQINLYNSFAK